MTLANMLLDRAEAACVYPPGCFPLLTRVGIDRKCSQLLKQNYLKINKGGLDGLKGLLKSEMFVGFFKKK